MTRIEVKKLLDSFPAPEPWVWGRAWTACAITIIKVRGLEYICLDCENNSFLNLVSRSEKWNCLS